MVLKVYLEAFLNLLYPHHCFSCKKSLHREGAKYLCESCRQAISYIRGIRCPRCGVGLGEYSLIGRDGCMECRGDKLRFDGALSATYYEGVIKELIHQFKYGRHDFLVNPLAHTLLEFVGKDAPLPSNIDRIVAVPLHWKKRMERGFNQAELLASRVARYMRVDLSTGGLQRVKETLSQSNLPYPRRKENVSDAFAVKRPREFEGRNVLLVDDVLTTGLTASECARVLKNAGAKKVYVLVLARSKRDQV
jgi:ComF family protein